MPDWLPALSNKARIIFPAVTSFTQPGPNLSTHSAGARYRFFFYIPPIFINLWKNLD